MSGTGSGGDVRKARRAVFVAAVLAGSFTAGTFLAPALLTRGDIRGAWLSLAYAPLCHQLPERSLAVGDGFQAVCARCSGLYLGAVAGLLVATWLVVGRRRSSPMLLLAVAVPTLVDFALPRVGLPGLTNLPRLLLAFPVGFVAACFLAWGIQELLQTAAPTPAPMGESLEVVDG